MRVYQKRSNLSRFLQVSSDGPNVNLKFLGILQQKQKDAEMKDLISVSACGLHYVHHGFQHGENASQWNLDEIEMNLSQVPWITLEKSWLWQNNWCWILWLPTSILCTSLGGEWSYCKTNTESLAQSCGG